MHHTLAAWGTCSSAKERSLVFPLVRPSSFTAVLPSTPLQRGNASLTPSNSPVTKSWAASSFLIQWLIIITSLASSCSRDPLAQCIRWRMPSPMRPTSKTCKGLLLETHISMTYKVVPPFYGCKQLYIWIWQPDDIPIKKGKMIHSALLQ